MDCPDCKKPMTIESTRQLGPVTRRVRICTCGKKWVTFEEVARKARRREAEAMGGPDRAEATVQGR